MASCFDASCLCIWRKYFVQIPLLISYYALTMDVGSESVSVNVSPYEDHSIWMRVPRKLNFSPVPSDSDSPPHTDILSPHKNSPPCRPLRTLRLSEKPTTPGTIYNNSNRKLILFPNVLSGRLSAPNLNPFTPESLARNRKRCRSEQQHNEWVLDCLFWESLEL